MCTLQRHYFLVWLHLLINITYTMCLLLCQVMRLLVLLLILTQLLTHTYWETWEGISLGDSQGITPNWKPNQCVSLCTDACGMRLALESCRPWSKSMWPRCTNCCLCSPWWLMWRCFVSMTCKCCAAPLRVCTHVHMYSSTWNKLHSKHCQD